MTLIARGIACALALLGFNPALAKPPAFPPVQAFELSRFLGTWYEIARIPNSFERDLVNVTATYRLKTDGRVEVLNEGNKKTPQGAYSKAIGKAKFAAATDVGYLRVSFFGPFYADYIVADLDSAYQHALVVSSPDLLWILSRTPVLHDATLTRLKSRSAALGFDTTRLFAVPQQW